MDNLCGPAAYRAAAEPNCIPIRRCESASLRAAVVLDCVRSIIDRGRSIPVEAKLQELKTRLLEIHDLNAAAALLQWDQATYMPRGGATARGRQLATLRRLAQEQFVDPAIGAHAPPCDRKRRSALMASARSVPAVAMRRLSLLPTRRRQHEARVRSRGCLVSSASAFKWCCSSSCCRWSSAWLRLRRVRWRRRSSSGSVSPVSGWRLCCGGVAHAPRHRRGRRVVRAVCSAPPPSVSTRRRNRRRALAPIVSRSARGARSRA